MNASFDFRGKKVLLTGAAGVIGTWVSRAFYDSGADLWLVDVNGSRLQELASSLMGKGVVCTSAVDLRKESDISRLRDEIEAAWGSPDFLVNIAGLYPSGMILDLPIAVWDKVMDVNVRAPFLMIQYFSKLMIKAKISGSIVNIISRSAKIPRVGAVHYAVSKAALEMLTRGCSMELAKYGIRVNAVSPGFAPGSDISGLSDDYISAMRQKIPLGRTSGPHDAPQAILFLCSENAAFITGASIYVDGGNTAGDFTLPVMG